MRAIEFLIPGNLDALTGGYLYDRHITSGLRARGWQVTVHGLDASFPMPTPGALAEVRALLAAQPDDALVLIDGLALGGLAATLGEHRARLRLVALVHHPLALETGLDERSRGVLYRDERDALQSARRVIVTSPWTQQALAEYDVAEARIGVVEPGTRQSEARSGAAGHPHRLLCVASLTPRKGHAWLLDALAQLPREQWRLDCIGSTTMDAACAAALRKQIDTLKLNDQVHLRGEVDPAALPACYTQADTFVLASFMEGYGMVLSEALAAGLPIVSTRAGAIPHVVPAAASLLVPPGDGAALLAALRKVLEGGAAWRRLAQGALAARAALPNWADAVQRFEAELNAVS